VTAKPADCALCGRLCPLGGVLDGVGRAVHLWCRELRKLEVADAARATAKRVAKEGRPVKRERGALVA
jgi:hypothetical protein